MWLASAWSSSKIHHGARLVERNVVRFHLGHRRGDVVLGDLLSLAAEELLVVQVDALLVVVSGVHRRPSFRA